MCGDDDGGLLMLVVRGTAQVQRVVMDHLRPRQAAMLAGWRAPRLLRW